MSASSATKTKASKDKVSMIKLAKSNQLSNDMQAFKISLGDVIKEYDAKMKVVYLDAIPSKTRLPKDDERVHCPVVIVALESVQKQIMKALFWKHFPLNGDALQVFLSFSEKYLTMTCLKFEDTQFQEADIILLAAFLRTNPNITDLNISGNAYNQNFKCLIQDTKLKYLTLRFCSINAENLEEFVEPLKISYRMPLVHLNLANNKLGDEGAKILADVLRVNRILISLNVAANGMSDEGAKEILRPLQMFCLDQEEISIRRKIYYQYYIKKYEEIVANSPCTPYDGANIMLSRSSSNSTTKARPKSKPSKSKSRKSSKSAASLSELSNRSFTIPRDVSSAPAPAPNFILPYAENSDLIATLDFHSAYHPFVKETTLNGSRFFCRGNFVLTHLNFAFNHLTSGILKDVQEVVKYQVSYGSNEEGLQNVAIYGNDMKSEDTENLENDLGDMLTMKTSRTESSSTVQSREMTKKSKRISK